MISEIRYLLFQEQDVLRALIEYRKSKNQPLPTGSIAKFKIQRKQPMSCTLSIHEDEAGRKADIIFTNDVMRAALISYCMYKKIPLPVRAEKELQVFGDRIGLLVSLNLTDAETEALRRRAG
ncbi:MAG: hypothetical protein IID48_02095 [Proteobacteria bacterium]|nr:hypothetical protein [Pseudomonadota bacterium]